MAKMNDALAQWGKLVGTAADNMQRVQFFEGCTKELAARFLRKVDKRTLPGQYPKSSGKVGGTLKRGWKTPENNEPTVTREGRTYRTTLRNKTEYASYVEYGHRTRGGKSWVPGKFIMTKSADEMKQVAPRVLQKRLNKELEALLGGK